MKKLPLHLLLAVAVLLACASCASPERAASNRVTLSTPQTGTNIGRRVAQRQTRQQAQRSTRERRARAAEQQKRRAERRAAREKERQQVDEDFVPRGGFR
jgi:hypothetical protein